VIWVLVDAEDEVDRLLVVHDRDGATRVPITQAREVRWLDAQVLLLSLEVAPEDPLQWGQTEIAALDLRVKRLLRLMSARRHYNLEVSPDRAWLVLGVEVNDRGDSDLEIWHLDTKPQRVATRREPLDEPRWSPDGVDLVAARAMQDPDAEESDTSAAIGGVGLVWPRLFRLRRDLASGRSMLSDGPPGAERAGGTERTAGLEPGGSFPLWWDSSGIFARQRRGLARCDPDGGGCSLVYAPGPERRITDGRRLGRHAMLLVLDTTRGERLPSEIHRVDLETGAGEVVFRGRPGVYVSDLDWTGAAEPE
jgi:hypothetical protein